MFKKFFRDTRPGPERLAESPWATATTPDQIIVAHILQSVAKKPDDWRWAPTAIPVICLSREYKSYDDLPSEFRHSQEYRLIGPDISIDFHRRAVNVQLNSRSYLIKMTVTVIQGREIFPLDAEAGNILTTRISTLFHQFKEAAKLAQEAKQAMEMNEKKWNFAERLLGMKRNEQGALVPAETAE